MRVFEGSPPRVWGRPSLFVIWFMSAGFTPTCVGKTMGSHNIIDIVRVHPHVCGEDNIRIVIRHFGYGSPPRVWGRLL